MKPLIERLASDLKFTLVGVDGGVEVELARSQMVRAVPTIAVYKNYKQIGSIAGAKTESQIKDFLFKHGVTQGELDFDDF